MFILVTRTNTNLWKIYDKMRHQNLLMLNLLELEHTELKAIEKVNTIDEGRSKIVRNNISMTGDKWQPKTLFLAIVDY